MEETLKESSLFNRNRINPRQWASGLFWTWNLIFLAFMVFGFAPRLLPELITAVRGGVVPAAFLAYGLILAAVPVAAVALGITVLRRSPERLFALGYAVEGPLMLMMVVRFFIIRQATPAVNLLLLVGALGMAAFLWQVLDRNIDRRGVALDCLRLFGLTLFLAVALYASVWVAFYAVPIAAQAGHLIGNVLRDLGEFLRNLGESLRNLVAEGWRWIPFWVLGILLFGFTATLFVLMPVAVPILAFRAWRRSLQHLVSRSGPAPAVGLMAAALVLFSGVFFLGIRQPQQLAFSLLADPPTSPAEAEALLEQERAIRAGLVNAYLAPMRYLSAVGEVDHVSDMYEGIVRLPSSQAEIVQRAYETVAQPLLYRPVNQTSNQTAGQTGARALGQEPFEAARLYQRFFDRPITTGERDTIVRAVRSTWSQDQALAAWQAVDDREVLLARQEVNIQEHGDWAEVELYEVYQNQTGERQEVVYYFSLPESAVVTGLWLGDSEDREARFVYRVAPRGAAQAVYRNELQRNIDPALVEQIGPRQYRLRIFPIPARGIIFDEEADRASLEEASPLHLWMSYRVMAEEQSWILPSLAEKRNVYWDTESVRLVNGEAMQVDEDAWLPEAVPARSAIEPAAHRVDFPNGVTVLAQPATDGEAPALDGGLRLAVVMDRSRSMQAQAAEVQAALERLQAVAGQESDIFLTASPYRGEEPARVRLQDFDPGEILYYGGQNAAELLAQFEALRAGETYDAILVLTDGSGYELGQSEFKVTVPDAPVWMVHLGNSFPLGYDDRTLEAIQASGGGVAGSLETALGRLTVARQGWPTLELSAQAIVDVIDGYIWATLPTEALASEALASGAASQTQTDPAFAPFAARRWILAEMQSGRGSPDRLATLDQLHAIAIENSVVTPFSSMIVLVNDEQRRLLEALEARDDRFQREYEQVGETEPPSPFAVTGVPEPEEWLLLGLAVALLGWYLYQSQSGQRRTLRRV